MATITLEQEAHVFMFEMAAAISNWSQVENCLRFLVSNCAGKRNSQLMAIGYLSIENFRSKLQFSDSLLRERIGPKADLELWAKLHERLRTLSQRRNKLVHRQMIREPFAKAGRRVSLVPWIDELRSDPDDRKMSRAKSKGRDRLCVSDIYVMRVDFLLVAQDLISLADKMVGRKVQRPIFVSLADRQKTLRQIVHQTLGELGLPPPPSPKKSQQEKSR